MHLPRIPGFGLRLQLVCALLIAALVPLHFATLVLDQHEAATAAKARVALRAEHRENLMQTLSLECELRVELVEARFAQLARELVTLSSEELAVRLATADEGDAADHASQLTSRAKSLGFSRAHLWARDTRAAMCGGELGSSEAYQRAFERTVNRSTTETYAVEDLRTSEGSLGLLATPVWNDEGPVGVLALEFTSRALLGAPRSTGSSEASSFLIGMDRNLRASFDGDWDSSEHDAVFNAGTLGAAVGGENGCGGVRGFGEERALAAWHHVQLGGLRWAMFTLLDLERAEELIAANSLPAPEYEDLEALVQGY